jgi:hypothetical protein
MTPTTDLQKPFTDGELRALLEQYPARPPTMGGSNVSHENSYLDHYVVSAWEKKCSAILKRREDAAPDLATRVLELEAENKRLRMGLVVADKLFAHAIGLPQDEQHLWLFSEEGMDAWQIVRSAIHQFEHEPLSDITRAALKGGEI